MGDLAIVWGVGAADAVVEDDDLLSEEGLRTAVLLSIFTDRRAEADDPLPGGDDDRRGWWGDEFLQPEGDRIGSRLWLLDRSKRQDAIIPRAEELAREALAWMLDDHVAARVDVTVEFVDDRLCLVVVIHRPQGDRVTFRFDHAWDGEAARAV